jgi:hypothetical protein
LGIYVMTCLVDSLAKIDDYVSIRLSSRRVSYAKG